MRRIGSLAAVVVVTGSLFTVAMHYRDEAISAGPSSEAEPAAAVLDPDLFRAEIEAVEAVLYHPAPPNWETPDLAGAAVMRLATRVLKSSFSPQVRRAGATVLELGGDFSARSDVGYATPDLVGMRHQWEAMRDQVFAPAPWFQGEVGASIETNAAQLTAASTDAVPVATTADLDQAQKPPAPPPLSRFEHRRYERVIEALARLGEQGRRKCRQLGEPDYDISVPTAHSERHVKAWFAWSREWEDDLFAAWREAPAAPDFSAPTDVVMAYQNLEQALRMLQLVPRGAGMWPTPFEAQWNERFDAAARHLDEVRDRLARVPVD